MQIHGPSSIADGSKFYAELNDVGDRPFASLHMGDVRFYIDTPEECDAAIRVWVEAKRLLLGEQDFCPATTEADGAAECGVTVYCDRKRGHAGSHRAPGPDEGSEVAWGGEVSNDDAAAIVAEAIRAGTPIVVTDDELEFAHIAIGDQP